MFEADYGILGLIFDITDGPMIAEMSGGINFSEDQLKSIKSCAFPDSIIQNQKNYHLFVYKIDNYYCHCIFTTHLDPKAPRGHIQISYVIATPLPYIYPFSRLLESSLQLLSLPLHDVIICLHDFLQKWPELTHNIDSDDPHDLSLFDGSLPVKLPDHNQMLSIIGGIGWNPLCTTYYLNNYFLDFDLKSSLSFDTFNNLHYSMYFLRLWEISVQNESLLVLAPTPQMSSSAVFAIASLSYYDNSQEPPNNVQPFIAASDVRFGPLVTNPSRQIIGVSNPIAIRYASNFDEIFNLTSSLGTTDLEKSPLKHACGRFKYIEQFSSIELRTFAFENTYKVANAIIKSLNNLRHYNPYAHYMGQMPVNFLIENLQNCGAYYYSSVHDFAQKLLRSPFYLKIWHQSRNLDSFMSAVSNFNVSELCNNWTEHELIDFYSLIEEVRKQIKGPPSLIKKIRNDLENVIVYLSPDLKLAPVY